MKNWKNRQKKLFIIGPNPFIQHSSHSPQLIFHIMKSRDQTSVLLSVVADNYRITCIFAGSASSSFRKTSEEVQREMEAEEQQRQILQSELEEKLEERKRSMELGSSENGLQLMERRQFRQFSRADEYLYAMKEDLAEWMNNLYPHIDMDADNFMNRLETGEHLVQVGLDSRQNIY